MTDHESRDERIFSSAETRRWGADLCRAGPYYVLSDETAASLARVIEGMFSAEARQGPIDARTTVLYGAYGAGKTLTSKLLCAALDPQRRGEAEAARVAARALDRGPLRKALEQARRDAHPLVAWCGLLEPTDISLHERVVGEVASRLGYCAASPWVAEAETRLERSELLPLLDVTAKREMKLSWDELRTQPYPDRVLARLLQAMPDANIRPAGLARYRTAPTRRFAVKEAVDLVRTMMSLRASEATLVLALDDVQQLGRDESLRNAARLVSSHLAQSLKGRFNVLGAFEAHGTDATSAQSFMAHDGSVHLSPASIRQTLHERLGDIPTASALYSEAAGRAFELALGITTVLSARHAERGHDVAPPRLVEHIEHIARGRRDGPTAGAVSPAGIVELASAAGPWLDPEVMATLEALDDVSAEQRDVLRAIAVLELLPEDTPRTAALIADCVAAEKRTVSEHAAAIQRALHGLSDVGALTHSRLVGYKVQTETGRAWLRMRDAVDVTTEETSEIVKEKLALLLLDARPPTVEDRTLTWKAKYADGRRAHDDPLFDRGHGEPIALDLRHLPLDRRSSEEWERRSVKGPLFHRLIWIAQGDVELVRNLSVDLAQARRMIARFSPVGTPLSDEHQRLLRIERDRANELDGRMLSAVEETFVAGTFYFRGKGTTAADLGTRFDVVLRRAAERVLPDLLGISTPPSDASEPETSIVVVTLPTGREIAEPEELDRLLEQIDERVRPLLLKGVKVRLR